MFSKPTSQRAGFHQRGRRGTMMVVFSLLMLSASAAMAQNRPITLTSLDRYRDQELAATISFWKGIQLRRGDGAPVKLGYFGGGYEDVFRGSPDALDSMLTYRRLKISATVLKGAALATILAQAALMISGELSTGDALFYGLLASGAALGLTGGLLSQGANAYLSDAVGQYNRDIFEELDRKAKLGARTSGVSFSVGGTF